MDVVGAVDLQVGVDNGSSALETAVSADLGSTDPVVGAASRRGLGKAGDVVFDRNTRRGDLPGDCRHLGDSLGHALETGNDGVGVGLVGKVGSLGNGHAEPTIDGSDTTGGRSTAEVVGDGHGVVVTLLGALNASGPLELAVLSVRTLDNLPGKRTNVGGRLGKDTGAALKVGLLVSGDRVGPSLVEVVEGDVLVLDDKVSVDVVVQVLSNRKVDPVARVDEGSTVLNAVLDDVELVSWADTAAEQELGRSKGTSGENDTASRVQLDGTAVAALELDTRGKTLAADNAPDTSVGEELEVGPAKSADEVGAKGTSSLATLVHEGRVREDTVLLVRNVVGGDLLPAIRREGGSEHVEALLLVTFAISGGSVSARNALENGIHGRLNVGRFPACREVDIPVKRNRLPPKGSVDSSSSTKNATSHLVGVGAGNTGGVDPDLVAKTGDVKSSELVVLEPVGLHGSAETRKRWGTLFDEENLLAGFGEPVRNGNTTGTSTHNDVVVGLGRSGLANALSRGGCGGGRDRCGGWWRWSALPVVVLCVPGVVYTDTEGSLSVVVLNPWLGGKSLVLRPRNDLVGSILGDLRAGRTVLVPSPAPLATVDELPAVSADSFGKLGDGGIAGVVIG